MNPPPTALPGSHRCQGNLWDTLQSTLVSGHKGWTYNDRLANTEGRGQFRREDSFQGGGRLLLAPACKPAVSPTTQGMGAKPTLQQIFCKKEFCVKLKTTKAPSKTCNSTGSFPGIGVRGGVTLGEHVNICEYINPTLTVGIPVMESFRRGGVLYCLEWTIKLFYSKLPTLPRCLTPRLARYTLVPPPSWIDLPTRLPVLSQPHLPSISAPPLKLETKR